MGALKQVTGIPDFVMGGTMVAPIIPGNRYRTFTIISTLGGIVYTFDMIDILVNTAFNIHYYRTFSLFICIYILVTSLSHLQPIFGTTCSFHPKWLKETPKRCFKVWCMALCRRSSSCNLRLRKEQFLMVYSPTFGCFKW